MNDFRGLLLRAIPLDGPEALLLIAELPLEYVARYGGPDETPVDPRTFDPSRDPGLNSFVKGLQGLGPVRPRSRRRPRR